MNVIVDENKCNVRVTPALYSAVTKYFKHKSDENWKDVMDELHKNPEWFKSFMQYMHTVKKISK